MKIRTIIADDERLARQRLRRLLSQDAQLEIVAECGSGRAALEAVRRHKPDLLLLDVEMPDGDGFDIIAALPSNDRPVTVFVTAYDRHAVRAFETCALDYLLKPTSAERVKAMLARVRNNLLAQPARKTTGRAATFIGQRHFTVRSGQRTKVITIEEIDWIEADGNYAILHVGRVNHLLRETMAALEKNLPRQFARVSRSAIVQLSRVSQFRSLKGRHSALLRQGDEVPITRSIREVEAQLRSL
jgi:two-component system, LytTR family, response regulator